MDKLKDYSGPFKPDLKVSDFSQEVLEEALKDVSRLYGIASSVLMAIDMEGYKASNGEELQPMSLPIALGRQELYWYRIVPQEIQAICARFGIRTGDGTVADLFKYWQIAPTVGLEKPITCELKDENHGTITMHKCLGLESLEDTDSWDLQYWMCHELSVKQYQYTAWVFNPKIKSTPTKLVSKENPRKSKDEPACVFELTMMDTVVDEEGYKAWQKLLGTTALTEDLLEKYVG